MRLIHADTREVFYRYTRCLKFKATRDGGVDIPHVREPSEDACGELHHNTEEEKRSTKTTISQRDEP